MSCYLHGIGASVTIASGIRIINESTRKTAFSEKRMVGTVKNIDRDKHQLTIHFPELDETVIVDAKDVKSD